MTIYSDNNTQMS